MNAKERIVVVFVATIAFTFATNAQAEPAWPSKSQITLNEVNWVGLQSFDPSDAPPSQTKFSFDEIYWNLGSQRVGAIVKCGVRSVGWGLEVEEKEMQSAVENVQWFRGNDDFISPVATDYLKKLDLSIIQGVSDGETIDRKTCLLVANSSWVPLFDSYVHAAEPK